MKRRRTDSQGQRSLRPVSSLGVKNGENIVLLDLSPEVRSEAPGAFPIMQGALRRLEEIEKDYILAVLDAKGGNRTQAALTLGIGSATLHRKLKSYKAP